MQVMTSGLGATRKTITAMLLAGVGAAMLPMPAAAQDDARLRKIEAELRALQRTVFPGGDGRYFTPEVDTSAPQQTRPVTNNPPANSALTDALARLDALEAQLARLTARSEESANQIAKLEAELAEAKEASALTQVERDSPTLSQSTNSRPGTSASTTPPRTGPVTGTPAPATTARTGNSTPPSSTRPGASTPASSSASSGPTAGRLAAVRAIAKPTTEDPGDDEYSYGFRLWEAGFFPEAQQQLSLFVGKYPNHARVSYGRNLLGRAYLDNGQPREAATHFFENYQANKQGARAGDSLLYLSEAMIAINDTNRACIALAEFSDSYPALATGRLKEQYDRTRNKVSCD